MVVCVTPEETKVASVVLASEESLQILQIDPTFSGVAYHKRSEVGGRRCRVRSGYGVLMLLPLSRSIQQTRSPVVAEVVR